jgi:transcriptional regulator with XRE-family HTH domain
LARIAPTRVGQARSLAAQVNHVQRLVRPFEQALRASRIATSRVEELSGLHRNTINNIRNGRSWPSVDQLARLAEAVGLRLSITLEGFDVDKLEEAEASERLRHRQAVEAARQYAFDTTVEAIQRRMRRDGDFARAVRSAVEDADR